MHHDVANKLIDNEASIDEEKPCRRETGQNVAVEACAVGQANPRLPEPRHEAPEGSRRPREFEPVALATRPAKPGQLAPGWQLIPFRKDTEQEARDDGIEAYGRQAGATDVSLEERDGNGKRGSGTGREQASRG